VVLVDEIDKADSTVPNGLLDALGHGRFEVDGLEAPVEMKRAPLVLITTNEERALPDAFLRRCVVLHLSLPEKRDLLVARLESRGRAHFPKASDCSDSVLKRAAEMVADDRAEMRERDLAPPGLAEYVDLLRAVTAQRPGDAGAQLSLLERVRQFALRKHPPPRDMSPAAVERNT